MEGNRKAAITSIIEKVPKGRVYNTFKRPENWCNNTQKYIYQNKIKCSRGEIFSRGNSNL